VDALVDFLDAFVQHFLSSKEFLVFLLATEVLSASLSTLTSFFAFECFFLNGLALQLVVCVLDGFSYWRNFFGFS